MTVAELRLWSSSKIILWLGVGITWGTAFKGCSIGNVEKNRSSGFYASGLIVHPHTVGAPHTHTLNLREIYNSVYLAISFMNCIMLGQRDGIGWLKNYSSVSVSFSFLSVRYTLLTLHFSVYIVISFLMPCGKNNWYWIQARELKDPGISNNSTEQVNHYD